MPPNAKRFLLSQAVNFGNLLVRDAAKDLPKILHKKVSAPSSFLRVKLPFLVLLDLRLPLLLCFLLALFLTPPLAFPFFLPRFQLFLPVLRSPVGEATNLDRSIRVRL